MPGDCIGLGRLALVGCSTISIMLNRPKREPLPTATQREKCDSMLIKRGSPENVDWMPVMSTPAARQGSARASKIGEPWLPGFRLDSSDASYLQDAVDTGRLHGDELEGRAVS